MQGYLLDLEKEALGAIRTAQSARELEDLKVKYLGRRQGELTKLIKDLPAMTPEEKRVIGPLLNQVKSTIEAALKEAAEAQTSSQRGQLPLDISAPGKKFPVGKLHPVTKAFYEIIEIFQELGFSFADGPEIEWFWYAFEALNIPPDHPAADDFETFFVETKPHPKYGRMLLRPHTSSVQVRVMQDLAPPIRVVSPGKTYRPNYDASHTPMFHQFEGLVIDKNTSIGSLKAVLRFFVQRFFGQDIKIRLRPFHFNFTEPSFEVDITCTVCRGKGCQLCQRTGWLELGGAGMVHPRVLTNVGLDPKVWGGYAWGWGIERCVAIRYQIPDIRLLYENDLRVLKNL
jgi:phenylalanyl-tRNA synthetase alpha chain